MTARRPARGERGMVTAELAVALPALLLVLALALGSLRLGIDRVRCLDAAQQGARLLARGEPVDRARAAALAQAPPGARVGLVVDGRAVRVQVRSDGPAVLGALGVGWSPEAHAVARREDVR